MAADKVNDPSENVITIRKGRGGYRPGAGRKPKDVGHQMRERGHYVYVIHEMEDDSVCKVGVASSPISRLSALQVGTWRTLSLACAFRVSSEDEAHGVEKLAHEYMRGLHVSGEWFRATPDVAERFVERACTAAGITASRRTA